MKTPQIHLIVFLSLLLQPFVSIAQAPIVKQWEKDFGATLHDYERGFLFTSDSNILIFGASNSDSSFDKTQNNFDSSLQRSDFWILKLDKSGNKIWDKTYGGIDDDYPNKMFEIDPNQFIVTGVSRSDSSGNKTLNTKGWDDIWVIVIDSNGNKINEKDFGGTNNDNIYSIIKIDDYFYLGGNSNSLISGDKTQDTIGGVMDWWLIKTDTAFNIIWDKVYGGNKYDNLRTLIPFGNNKILMAGTSESDSSGTKSQDSRGASDFWVTMIDTAGNKIWDKRYGGLIEDFLYRAALTLDNCFLLGGYSRSDAGSDKCCNNHGWSDFDLWIIKIDSSGNKLWDRSFGGFEDDQYIGSFENTSDSCIIVGAVSHSVAGGDKSESNISNGDATWILKLDRNGNKLWDKTLPAPSMTVNSRLFKINDKTFYVVCSNSAGQYTGGWKNSIGHGGYDYWVLKIKDTANATNISLPVVNFNSSLNYNCGSACVDFTDLTVNTHSSWFWKFPGAIPSYSTDTNPKNICYFSPGTYDVTLSVCNYGGCDSVTYSSFIIIPPQANAIITQSFDTLFCNCIGTDSIQWFDSNGAILGENDTMYVTNFQTGNFYCEVLNSYGCDSISQVYTINSYGLPQIQIAVNDTQICNYQCLDFYDISANNPNLWIWSFPGSITPSSTQQNPSNVCFNGLGYYDVKLVACNSYGCDSFLFQNFIHANPPPIDSIGIHGDTLYSFYSGVSYQWYGTGLGYIPGANDSIFIATQTAFYNLILTDTNGCSNISNYIGFTSDASIAVQSLELKIKPNPNNGNFSILDYGILSSAHNIEIKIRDTCGKLIYFSDKFNNSISLEVDPGVYFVEVVSAGKIFRSKFLVNK